MSISDSVLPLNDDGPRREIFRGAGVALVTPFDGETLHERALRELVEFQLVEGIDALVVCGSTGEAATMSPQEQSRAVSVVVESAEGRVPVIAGVGGSDTAVVCRLAASARQAGADAVLAAAPPYNKPGQAGMLAHFRAVLDAGDLPMIVYNVPGRTACNILPETVEALAEDERVVGVKEASGDISQAAELCRRVGGTIAVYSGNDDQVIPLMALGGRGIISVVANVAPRTVTRMTRAFLNGDIVEARRIQLEYLPLMQALFLEPNPVPVKAAVGMLGFEAGDVRLPLLAASEETLAIVKERMAALGIVAQAGVS